MKVLSLFSGVGGFDMGLENAGMETAFQCEWDKNANNILAHHWPNVPKWDDVSTLTGKYVLEHAPVIDVVAWGSPCQDLSVAGRRKGLDGERSGLFHEGIRIIKEIREETNGKYPKFSIWENVAGALSSNRGLDFGSVLDEMAKAGAVAIEWALLDAQHFGVPQRRRRCFVVAVFDSGIAEKCPTPLLPVAESVPGDPKKSKPKRKIASTTLTEGTGADDAIVNAIGASIYHHGTVVNQDVSSGHMVVEGFTPSSFANYTEGVGTLRSNGGDLGGGSETLITEPLFFDPSHRQDGVRMFDGVSPTLAARMGTGGGNTPAVVVPIQDGRDIEKHQNGLGVGEDGAPSYTIDQTGAQSVFYSFDSTFGRSATVNDNISPTIKSVDHPAVAYGIQGNVIGRQDHNGPAGKGFTEEDGPMFTLTSTDVHAVSQTVLPDNEPIQYDGYNQSVNTSGISQSLRVGRDSSDFVAQPIEEPTVFQPGTMVRLGGGVWEGTVPTLRAESRRGDNEPHIQMHNSEPEMAVRRLTPLECERLMGWPDDHTKYRADGTIQPDSHRYKQCGNGVASPVAQWVGKQLMDIVNE